MKLSRKIPERTITLEALWLKRQFTTMSDRYRAIREKFRNKMMNCYWCKKAFENGDPISLACFKGKGNKVLCDDCADALGGEDE